MDKYPTRRSSTELNTQDFTDKETTRQPNEHREEISPEADYDVQRSAATIRDEVRSSMGESALVKYRQNDTPTAAQSEESVRIRDEVRNAMDESNLAKTRKDQLQPPIRELNPERFALRRKKSDEIAKRMEERKTSQAGTASGLSVNPERQKEVQEQSEAIRELLNEQSPDYGPQINPED